MSTHLPLRPYGPLHRQRLLYPLLSRSFSSTPTWARATRDVKKRGRADPVLASTAARRQQRKASSALQEERLSDERNVPDDIGLVPGTFVHAPLRLHWEWTPFSSVTTRLWYEWKWATSRATAWYQLWRFQRSFSKRPAMHWFGNREQLRFTALEKYKHLHESFARADTKAISEVCVSSVAKKFQKRIDCRPPGLAMHWSLNNDPKCTIVSNLASPLSLPGYEETGIHQVVFRIQSFQTLQLLEPPSPYGAEGSAHKSQSDSIIQSPDKVVEYLVLQRQFIRGSDKKWRVWGFTDYSTPDTIESSEAYARGLNAFQTA